MAGVFEDDEVVFATDFVVAVHVDDASGEVDGHDGFGARGDGGFNGGGVKVPGVVNVGEDGGCPGPGNGAGGGDEGVGGDDDFVAGAYAKGAHGDFDGGGSAGAGDAVFGVLEGGIFLFEAFDTFAEPPFSRGGDFLDGGAFLLVKIGPGHPFLIRTSYRCPAMDSQRG